MLPRVDLPDVLLEVHGWTGCIAEHTHISEARARMGDWTALSSSAIAPEKQRTAQVPGPFIE
jgi:hypothetical protein